MSKRTILIVSAGVEAIHGIRRAQEMGLRVIVSDRDPNAPGFLLANDGLEASTYDPEATANAAEAFVRKKGRIDGVMTIGADVPLTVATVAKRLGLPGISLETARLAQDKLAMKRRFAESGVPIPWFAPAPAPSDVERARDDGHALLVVKPVDSRGGRGVQRLTPNVSARTIWEAAAAQSPTGRVMIEQYLPGPQVSTESILWESGSETPGFSDRNYELLDIYAPYFIENGGDLPSALPRMDQDRVKRTAELAGRALGIRIGNIKGDMVVHDGKPYVIELAARASGGYFCTREIPMNTGVDFIGAVIKMALGEPVFADDLRPRFHRPVVQRYAFPAPGKIVSIEGETAARAVPGVEELLVTAKIGATIRPPTDSNCTAAMVLTFRETLPLARAAAAEALETLKIQTDPT